LKVEPQKEVTISKPAPPAMILESRRDEHKHEVRAPDSSAHRSRECTVMLKENGPQKDGSQRAARTYETPNSSTLNPERGTLNPHHFHPGLKPSACFV
jgi:hypothetical protein